MKSLSWITLFPLLIILAVSGCSKSSETTSASPAVEDSPTAVTDAATSEEATTTAADPAAKPASDSASSANTTTATTTVDYSEADYAAWTQRYSSEFAFYNATSGAVNVRTGPSTQTAIQKTLAQNGLAGYIKTCSADLEWCQFEDGDGQLGWISMSLVGAAPDGPDPAGSNAAQSSGTQPANAVCEVRGASDEIRFEGDCVFQQEGGNGSFSIQAPSGLIDGRSLISVSIIQPGVAEVRGLTTDGINSRWGEATRLASDSACWAGDDFTICAR